MALTSAMVDRAFLQRRAADALKVNGRTVHSNTESPEIRARLTKAPAGERAEDGRKVAEDRPTLLLARRDAEREAVVPRKTDRLRIVSRELGEGVWEVDGIPQPLRKKRRVIGWTMSVVQLEED